MSDSKTVYLRDGTSRRYVVDNSAGVVRRFTVEQSPAGGITILEFVFHAAGEATLFVAAFAPGTWERVE